MTDKDRAAFEKWALENGESIAYAARGGYKMLGARRAWKGYKKGYEDGYQAAHDAAMAAEQRPWPFVNSPQEVADKMSDAIRLFEGDMLAALRHVFIEKQEPVSARIALQAAQQREAECRNALDDINLMACYASEEDIDSREVMLLRIGEYARAALATQPTSKGETT